MSKAPDLSDYVEVPERIEIFREKYPNGSLQAEVVQWPTQDVPFVTVRAYAYRSESDARPGTGLAWEPYPGRTPYTKDSELQNAETSAWGRAIVAALAADAKRGIASREEVRNRSGAEQGDAAQPVASPPSWDAPPPEDPWGPPAPQTLDVQPCPDCGGPMWDNRPKKAAGEFSPKAPDFKCKDKSCEGVVWPPKVNS